jgi:hypothetical protein
MKATCMQASVVLLELYLQWALLLPVGSQTDPVLHLRAAALEVS